MKRTAERGASRTRLTIGAVSVHDERESLRKATATRVLSDITDILKPPLA